MKSVKNFFTFEDGGKRVLHTKRVVLTLLVFLFLGIVTAYLFSLNSVAKVDSKTTQEKPIEKKTGDFKGSEMPTTQPPIVTKNKIRVKRKEIRPIPIGEIRAIGKLITNIDTRTANAPIKVLLPFGPLKGTILIGKSSYSGQGERIEISFKKGAYPDGTSFLISGNALDAKDFNPGIKGEYHSQTVIKNIGRAGLNLVRSAITGIHSAAIDGISTMAESNEDQPYVTVKEGKAIIVLLNSKEEID